jgi:hypothetical protein
MTSEYLTYTSPSDRAPRAALLSSGEFCMKKRSRLLLALCAPIVMAFAAAADAQNCTNGNNIYHRRIATVEVSCSQESCHGNDPRANKNDISTYGQQAQGIETALDTISDMSGLRASLGLTSNDIADLALYIWYRAGNQQCPAATPSVGASPGSLAFGTVTVGSSSGSQTITVSNTGGGAATGMTYGAAPAGFARTHNCPASLGAGASCTINVTFSPTAAQAYGGSITITGSGGTNVSIALSGTGGAAAAPNVTASPGSLSFGGVTVGSTSSAQTVTVSNTGSTAATGVSVGAAPAGFARTTTCTATLGAGASCTISVTFSPTAAQGYGGNIAITGSGGTNVSVSLSGTGSATASPNVGTSANSLVFGNVTVGQSSAAQTITVSNSGTAPANDMSYPAAPARYGKSGTCGSATLGAGASCTIVFTYSPTAVGNDNATYTFTGGGRSLAIALSGSGVSGTPPPAGQLSMPSSVAMPATNVGASSAPQAVSLSNIGGASVSVSSITSSNAGEFAVSGSTCANVGAGGGCSFNITFTPAGAGARGATITVVSNGTGSPQSITVTGTGNTAGGGGATTALAVEFYHAAFDHYFVTTIQDEITKLDNGTFVGWTRTGKQFKVYVGPGAGLFGVCRFFSTSFDPKSSHFYTADANECTVVKANKDWTFEATVFYVPVPTVAGSCPIGTMPVFRLYNNGQGGAPNHRLTIETGVVTEMTSRPPDKKWVPEGYGVGVTMCSPP